MQATTTIHPMMTDKIQNWQHDDQPEDSSNLTAPSPTLLKSDNNSKLIKLARAHCRELVTLVPFIVDNINTQDCHIDLTSYSEKSAYIFIGITPDIVQISNVQQGNHLVLEHVTFKQQNDNSVIVDDVTRGGGVTLRNSFGCLRHYLRLIWSELMKIMWVTCPDMSHLSLCPVVNNSNKIGAFDSTIMPCELLLWDIVDYNTLTYTQIVSMYQSHTPYVKGGFICTFCYAQGSSILFEWKSHIWECIVNEKNGQSSNVQVE